MADLKPEALAFLTKYCGYDDRGRISKKLMRGRMEKFWRRKEKVEAELALLPKDHPDLRKKISEVRNVFGNIIKLAKGPDDDTPGDLKLAYEKLDAVKNAARHYADIIKGEVQPVTLLNILNPTLVTARAFVTQALAAVDAVENEATRIEGQLDQLVSASEGKTRDEIITRAGRSLGVKNRLMEELDTLDKTVEAYNKSFEALFNSGNFQKKRPEIEHVVTVLEAKGAMPGPLKGSLDEFIGLYDTHKFNGNRFGITDIYFNRSKACRGTVTEACAKALALPDMGEPLESTDKKGNRLNNLEASVANSDLKAGEDGSLSLVSKFADLEKKDAERLAAAKQRMQQEALRDFYLEKRPIEPPEVVASRVTKLQTADLFDGTDPNLDASNAAVTPEAFAAASAKALEDNLEDMLRTYDYARAGTQKVPDEVLEVATRTLDDWMKEVADGLGYKWDPAVLSPDLVAKIKTAAQALQDKSLALYPDKAKASEDGGLAEFTMGGVTYDRIKLLAKGGFGKVYLAQSFTVDQAGKEYIVSEVVIKELLNPDGSPDDMREEMATEIKAQRAITGGESGDCPPNLMEHKGMVLSPSGIPMPVMDLAKGGDANEFDQTMSGLSGSGMISETARQALMAAQMRDVLKGVKAMHDQGYAHFDLKELNVFMTEDGTFKVADFGLVQEAEDRDDVLKADFETTPQYKAPEIKDGDDLNMSGDIFSLGMMLKRQVSPIQATTGYSPDFDRLKAGPGADMDEGGEVVQVSASTRLIAALANDDPSKRPSIESALASSYFSDISGGFDPADVTRLRKAAAAYAATVGRKTKSLDARIVEAESAIAQNQRKLNGDYLRDAINEGKLFLSRSEENLERLDKMIAVETDLDKKAALEKRHADVKDSRKDVEDRVKADEKRVGDKMPDSDVKKLKGEIDTSRKNLEKLRAEVTAIRDEMHKDPAIAEIMKELEEANAAFR